MLNKIKDLVNKRAFHVIIITSIIIIVVLLAVFIMLKYSVEGEKNMPFELTKISIISSSEGIDKKEADSKWDFNVDQFNDIYLYIEKNKNYGKTEYINEVIIDDINIDGENLENIKIYKPDDSNEKVTFSNKDENEVNNIKYEGDVEGSIKKLKISNQGGILAFRCSNNNVIEYKSNDDIEIIHDQLLKKSGITQDKLEIKLSFNLTLKLENMKEYQTRISLNLPINGVIEKGKATEEKIDLNEYIFKRIKN